MLINHQIALNRLVIKYAVFALISSFPFVTNAQTTDILDVDTFLAQTDLSVIDCPSETVASQTNYYLDQVRLTQHQRFELETLQAYNFICNNQPSEAVDIIESLLINPAVDKSAEYYATAVYHRGFLYDQQEEQTRCDYYQRALLLSETRAAENSRFEAITFRASLNMIPVCIQNDSDSVKLGRLYALLEKYANAKDVGLRASVLNSIGIQYGQMGQHVLAAEQFLSAHELGFERFNGSNKLSMLISAISSLMASGNYEGAKQAIDEFVTLNQTINTPMTNFWQVFAQAGYYYRTQDFERLADTLAFWSSMPQSQDAPLYNALFKWYETGKCIQDNDIQCLRNYLQYEASTPEGFKNYVSRNKYYLKFKVDLLHTLGRYEEAFAATELFSDRMMEIAREQQSSGKVLGVASLHNQIISLENSLSEAQQQNQHVLVSAGVGASFLFFTGMFLVQRKRREHKQIDPATQLLNNTTALQRIAKLPEPQDGKINALAIFDLGNFREVNLRIGSANSDVLLLEIANTFRQITRESDILGRFAPEQFIICLSDIDEQMANNLFDRIQQALENSSFARHQNQNISVRSSTEVYISTDKFDNLQEILDDMLLGINLKNKHVVLD